MTSSSCRRPNVLVLTCHDLGRYLGCYGVPTVRSPRLDLLAAEGVRFAQHFCVSPQCSASRATMFTGRYPHANGVMGLTHGDFAWDINPDERLIGQELRDAGYATFMLGIHHESRQGPGPVVAERCGMDEVVPPAPAAPLVDAAIDRARRAGSSGRPFYIQVGFHEPHRIKGAHEPPGQMGFIGDEIAPDDELGVHVPPYLADDAGTRAELAELQGAIHAVDREIGRLLDLLDAAGLTEDTLVVATTDHGVAMPRAKCSLYDPGIEGALIARWPARGWSGGRVVERLVSNVDLLPTLLDAAGLPISESVQGHSLAPLLDRRGDIRRDAVFSELTWHDYYDPRRAVRTTTHKLILNFSAAPAFMDPTQSWHPRSRPAVPAEPALAYAPPVELYDLTADPWEWRNLAADPRHAAIRDTLLAQLGAWMRETGDPLLDGEVASPSHRRAVAALDAAR